MSKYLTLNRDRSKYFLLILLFSLIGYYWANHLNDAAYSNDRAQYMLGFEEERSRTFEPLWTAFSFAAYRFSGELSYELTVYLIVTATSVALIRFRLPPLLFALIILSPGFAYLLTNALRQGFAIALFLLALSCSSLIRERNTNWRSILFFFLIVICTSLIHNSLIIATLFLILILLTQNFCRSKSKIKVVWMLLLATSGAAIVAAPGFSGTAMTFLSLNTMAFLYCATNKQWRVDYIVLGLFFFFCTLGYITTNTGLRVVIMCTMIAPIFPPKIRQNIVLIGLFANPIMQYGGYLIENNGSP